MADAYTARLKKLYDDTIAKAMTEKFGYKNALEIPRIDKIVINMGVGPGQEARRTGRFRDGIDRGPEAGDHHGEEVDRAVQAA